MQRLIWLFKSHSFSRALFIIISKISYIIFAPFIRCVIGYTIKTKDDRLVFISSPDYSDNGRALSDYLINSVCSKKYKIIWLVKNLPKKPPKNVMFIKARGVFHGYLSIRGLYYLQSAKMIFYTHGIDKAPRKKAECPLVVNLWHGCGYKANKRYKANQREAKGRKHFLSFDYVLVPGELFIEPKALFFGCSKEQVLPLGYPRYDLLTTKNKAVRKYITTLKKSDEEKLIIWMPTFRKSKSYSPENEIFYEYDLPIVASEQELRKLDQYCYENQVIILIKRHKNQIVTTFNRCGELTNIFFIDDKFLDNLEIQLYELLGETNALITDYSSVAIDYLLLDKPIGFTLDDFEEYKSARGFVFDDPKRYMPGHHIYTYTELCQFISDISMEIDVYKEKREIVRIVAHRPTTNYCEEIARYFGLVP